MQTDDIDVGKMRGEVRIRVEGGVAHFPGLAREQVISFDDLDVRQRQEIVALADETDFFDRAAPVQAPRPDARTYTIRLAFDGRSREVRVAEPIRDLALAKLISTVRRLSTGQTNTGAT